MRFVLFYHSLVSDWNHASAHFLRGVATELLEAGHAVRIFEPADGWSLHNLREQGGDGVVKAFHATYPRLRSTFFDPQSLDLDEALSDADVVIAHEWNDPGFLGRLGAHRAATRSYRLLFHDAPHRTLQKPAEIRAQVLGQYDGVLACSESLRQLYLQRHWTPRAWTWREAVDARVFRPFAGDPSHAVDLVWIGSWGNAERANELNEFLLEPIRALRLRARFYGARYPEDALRQLRSSGIDYGGWLPDFSLPVALAGARFTVNIPRRMRSEGLPHTSVMRALQGLSCGIPVVSTPWEECTAMLTPGRDLLIAQDRSQMQRYLQDLRQDPEMAGEIAAQGHRTVLTHHTCAHRAHELLMICGELGIEAHLARSAEMRRRIERISRSHAPAAWS